MNDKISIIVPIYNLEKYIKRCIESILCQTYQNIEIILVDDGSTDNSRVIIGELVQSDNRIKGLYKKHGGVTLARLAGVKVATGEWVGFVDGDDEIENDMYEVLLRNAIEYNVDISHCGYQMIFADGRVNYFYNTGCIYLHDRKMVIKELLEGTMIEPGLCNKLFKKILFNELLCENKIPTEIRINEDLLMNYFLFSQIEKAVFKDICKYHYIIRYNSASRQELNNNKIFDPIRVKQIIVENSEIETIPYAKKAYMSTCVNVYNSLALTKGSEYKNEKKQVRNTLRLHKAWIYLLSKKQKILAGMILYIPFCYPIIYKVYVKYFMKNPYA